MVSPFKRMDISEVLTVVKFTRDQKHKGGCLELQGKGGGVDGVGVCLMGTELQFCKRKGSGDGQGNVCATLRMNLCH